MKAEFTVYRTWTARLPGSTQELPRSVCDLLIDQEAEAAFAVRGLLPANGDSVSVILWKNTKAHGNVPDRRIEVYRDPISYQIKFTGPYFAGRG